MSAKKIFVLCLLIALFLHESSQKILHSPLNDDDNGVLTYQHQSQVSVEHVDKRRKRSPCVVGTRWRTRRCRLGKRAISRLSVSVWSLSLSMLIGITNTHRRVGTWDLILIWSEIDLGLLIRLLATHFIFCCFYKRELNSSVWLRLELHSKHLQRDDWSFWKVL